MDDGKRLNGEGVAQLWDAMVDYIDNYLEEHGRDPEEVTGTVKMIRAGEGLYGGIITTIGTITLKPATITELGGIYISYNDETNTCNISTRL